MFCALPPEREAHRRIINVLPVCLLQQCMCTWVSVPKGFIDGHCCRTVTAPGTFCNEGAGVGTRGQTENWNHLFPPLSTDWHKLEPDHLWVLPPSQSASPRAISLVLFSRGVGKLGWAVWRERRGQLRERGDLSACLNMDKLHYFFQPSVQSFPFFPIILCVNEVAWVMMEEEKNTPLLPLKKKKKERFGTWDEDRIHVRRECISGGMPGCFLGWRVK